VLIRGWSTVLAALSAGFAIGAGHSLAGTIGPNDLGSGAQIETFDFGIPRQHFCDGGTG
jgi:hypothetical protein